MSRAQQAQRAADGLSNVERDEVLCRYLSEVEFDWLVLLKERLYEISRGRVTTYNAGDRRGSEFIEWGEDLGARG